MPVALVGTSPTAVTAGFQALASKVPSIDRTLTRSGQHEWHSDPFVTEWILPRQGKFYWLAPGEVLPQSVHHRHRQRDTPVPIILR